LEPSAARIDFYVLAAPGASSRLHFACRLTEKAYGMDTNVYAHTSSPGQADQLDQLLWTFRDGSFVPHERLVPDRKQARAPIRIGTPEVYSAEGEFLINLCDVVPTFFSATVESPRSWQPTKPREKPDANASANIVN